MNELEEKHIVAVDQKALIQKQRSNWHDWFIKKRVFYEGDWALLYDSRFKRDFKAKQRTRWLGPYQIKKVIDDGMVHWVTIDEDQMALFANGHRMRLYHKQVSKDAFISHVAVDPCYHSIQGQ